MLIRPEFLAAAEASRRGASISLDRGSKHLMIVVHVGDNSRKFTIDGLTRKKSKERMDWIRQNIRRIVKELKSIGLG